MFRIYLALASLTTAVMAVTQEDNSYQRELTGDYWLDGAHGELQKALENQNKGVAKNIILFIGDGMGPTSVTAGRILAGQLQGKKGEEFSLTFEKFPQTGLSKTYAVDQQVTDSAAAATAFLCGVKTNRDILGLNARAQFGNCSSTTGANVHSILRWATNAGKSTGIVTTTRITHATPAGAYAHSPDRDWESDRLIPSSEKQCKDIAYQLIKENSDINVILGGGRAYFYPENYTDPDPDPKFNTSEVSRTDGLNLIQEWEAEKKSKGVFVYNKQGLDKVDVSSTDYLLGLFTQDHMSFDVERNASKEPALHEMVEKAVRILQRNKNGFFLLVEGGRIDSAHHDTQPVKAIHDVVAMDKAVKMVLDLTDSSDTLTVVTADHSHVMSIAGYATRGNPIFALSDLDGVINTKRTLDHLPFTTLVYANGPGYKVPRPNITKVETGNVNYVSQSAVPMKSETHGGEDVAIYAHGPQSFLFAGVHEQSYIPVAMAYASCIGPYAKEESKLCARPAQNIPTIKNSSSRTSIPRQPYILLTYLSLIYITCHRLVL
ncbi:alkaline phosphatase [Biomphalaria pfeifferi]|uniref:Alkaline phosphatase n=1 Tax=Biomphalaria pfeifferi TaxID=112525 RepID=A0AAD8FEJ1_BIOPF|nr:alkaline phosphatase [Biomphalaria pfeifferi]